VSDAQWYAQMAEAMATREKCLTAIGKWQEKLTAAEELIQQLRNGDVTEDPDDPDVRLATAVEDWKVQQEPAVVNPGA